jgi:hypothetical protein
MMIPRGVSAYKNIFDQTENQGGLALPDFIA